jgi:ATP-dependent RNA helicase DeaD
VTLIDIAAPLAAALADKGYATLTAVQEAMLTPDAQGRDLLVSAQTGSGKTVAFGLAIAPDLLDGSGYLPLGTGPVALAIAPTRELALQVAGELRWLYAATGARIATCVGGMDYRAERRALDRGAQIVVGTPGRLRDHIERGGLVLAGLRVAVLDEADEMLDLGFREDLEFILHSAPATRRTLMFSATVPPAIEKLARDFQRDGLRVAAMGEARQHGDIAYRALSVAQRDRENAIFNLLRYHEAKTAIVFCKTRANVNHLLARMNNRGFRAVALSGELSQTERTHALQALRDGRSRVCIATDVAARGIDLPGLELVIHADLPTNADTLLHRSGRTGRAGAKGISALIVTPSELRKAQRLLQGARVVADWGKAPSADDVNARDDVRMLDHPALSAPMDDMGPARDLIARFGAEQVAAAFVQLWREGRPPPEELSDIVPPPQESGPRPVRTFGASVWFALSVGHTGRAEARWLLPKICEAGGITRDAIGAIRVRENESFVQIAVADAPRFGQSLEIEPGLMMRRLEGEPALDAKPERRAPPKPRNTTRDAAPRRIDAVEAVAPVAAYVPPAPVAPLPAAAPAKFAKPAKSPRPAQSGRPAEDTEPARPAKVRPPKAPPPKAGSTPPATRNDGPAPVTKAKPKPKAKAGKPASSKGRRGAMRNAEGGDARPRRPKGRN